MVLKFRMQHNEAAGLQNDQIEPGRGSKKKKKKKEPLLLKIAKPLKSTFTLEPLEIFC